MYDKFLDVKNNNNQNGIYANHNDFVKSFSEYSRNDFIVAAYIMSMISKEDTKLHLYVVNIDDLATYLDYDKKTGYSYYLSIAKSLQKKLIYFTSKSGREAMGSLVSHSEYDKETREVYFSLNEWVVDYLINLTNNYTLFSLNIISSLKGKYSIKIYQIIKMEFDKNNSFNNNNSKKFTITFNIDRLMMITATSKSMRYSHLKKIINEDVIPDLNKNSDLTLLPITEENERKRGNKIISVDFNIVATGLGMEEYQEGYFRAEDYSEYQVLKIQKGKKRGVIKFIPLVFTDDDNNPVYDEKYIYFSKHYKRDGSDKHNCKKLINQECPYCDNSDYVKREYCHIPVLVLHDSFEEWNTTLEYKMIELPYDEYKENIEEFVERIYSNDLVVQIDYQYVKKGFGIKRIYSLKNHSYNIPNDDELINNSFSLRGVCDLLHDEKNYVD